jgi:hypothetical protein
VPVKPGKDFDENLFSEDNPENLFSEDNPENLFSEDCNGNLYSEDYKTTNSPGIRHGIEGELPSLSWTSRPTSWRRLI